MHELAHAWVALYQGDETAYRQGYLTLNPLKVMGQSALVVLILFGFAWGAVPVNPRAMRHRSSPVLVACAGPGANLLLAILFALAYTLFQRFVTFEHSDSVLMFWKVGLQANCFLLVFNMLPIPILDGWQLYSWLIPQLKRLNQEKLASIGLVAILVLFVSPAGRFVWMASSLFGNKMLNVMRILFG